MKLNHNINRRKFLTATALLGGGALLPKPFAFAQAQKVRVGMMLPYTGTYAQLGIAITNGFQTRGRRARRQARRTGAGILHR